MTARVSITSPINAMPSTYRSSYTPNRRYSLSGSTTPPYQTTYTSQYGTTSRGVRTGATSDSYRNASRTFESPSSHSYVSTKPPAYKSSSRITSPSPARTYGSSRPLPAGPGPRDSYGQRTSVHEALRTTRNRASTPTRRPLKADHTYHTSTESYTPREYNASNYTSSDRLSRAKRTNSINDLTSGVDNVSLNGSLSRSRKYGSTADVNGNVKNGYLDESIDDINSSNKSTPTKTYKTKASLTDSLPDINDRPNSATRSPSVDRGRSKREGSQESDTSVNSLHRNNSLNNNVHYGGSSRRSPDAHSTRGLVGLRNLGNTCFMNCIIQCLSNTPRLRDFLISDQYLKDINTKSRMKGALARSFASLLKSMWSKASPDSLSPNDFKDKISKFAPKFIGYNQQDAQEILIYLLEGLHEDLNRRAGGRREVDTDGGVVTTPPAELAARAWRRYTAVDDSLIVDTFVGQLRSALTCTVCGYVSNTFDTFTDLSLPIRKGRGSYGPCSLYDCFDLFTQEEVLDGEERPTCARCKKRQKCTKHFSIQRFPDYLIIHLKRFNQGSYYRNKLSTQVDFAVDGLDLSDYAASDSTHTGAGSSSRGGGCIYDLYGVSNHSGNTGGGHYTAYARHPETRQWHHFNDQRVSGFSASRVVTSEGYVLFYRHRGAKEPSS